MADLPSKRTLIWHTEYACFQTQLAAVAQVACKLPAQPPIPSRPAPEAAATAHLQPFSDAQRGPGQLSLPR